MKPQNPHRRIIDAVVADTKGRIFELPGFGAVGADGAVLEPLDTATTQPLAHGSELMMLPDRVPLLLDRESGTIVAMEENPFAPGQPIFPVAAFNSPGRVVTHTCAHRRRKGAGLLPLFSYGAVGWYRGRFRSAAVVVDREPRQDLRHMPLSGVRAGIAAMRRRLPDNRLARHLETCALTYGCPAAKNFFLGRYEAPLPTARACPARCQGCLSLQPEGRIPVSQNRIAFTPSAEEIAQVALTHIRQVPKAVVSFGQGCEGDPLTVADIIAEAVATIRRQTDAGTINVNTNGFDPRALGRLIDAGIDSIRVSINSLRPACYSAYFRPKGYRWQDVVDSIDVALDAGIHVSINYLNLPGFTDSRQEVEALEAFLQRHPVDMIQWRNLNYDPLAYLQAMDQVAVQGRPMGVARLLQRLGRRFGALRHGYFNPPKQSWGKPRKPHG